VEGVRKSTAYIVNLASVSTTKEAPSFELWFNTGVWIRVTFDLGAEVRPQLAP